MGKKGGHHLPALIYGPYFADKKHLPPRKNPVGSTLELVVENPTFMPINDHLPLALF